MMDSPFIKEAEFIVTGAFKVDNPCGAGIALYCPKSIISFITCDSYFIRCIEQAWHIFFEEHIGKDLSSLGINVRVKGLGLKRQGKAGSMEADYFRSVIPGNGYEEEIPYHSLNPGVLKADFYHRYIEVPVDYSNRDAGSFKLYYELDSGFDPDSPTILIPTDGQRLYSQAGWADRYKKIFSLESNVVTYEYRGMSLSPVKCLQPGNWVQAYRILNTDNVVEDIESIRRDILGNREVNILGGSGIAMMGLKYISKYYRHVRRAFLMSFFRDASGSSEAGRRYFRAFIEKNGLKEDMAKIIASRPEDVSQLLFMAQKLLYYDEGEAVLLISGTASGTSDRFDRYLEKMGTSDFFIRFYRKYCPWSVVFMFETNIRTADDGYPDINYPYLQIGEPLSRLQCSELAEFRPFDIKGLEKAQTEILLLAGTLDQVAPLDEMEKIHHLLPDSRLAVFDAYHCLQVSQEARKTRNLSANIFFRHGLHSKELDDYLQSREGKGKFIKFYEKPGNSAIMKQG